VRLNESWSDTPRYYALPGRRQSAHFFVVACAPRSRTPRCARSGARLRLDLGAPGADRALRDVGRRRAAMPSLAPPLLAHAPPGALVPVLGFASNWASRAPSGARSCARRLPASLPGLSTCRGRSAASLWAAGGSPGRPAWAAG
jgi:hypothetical protein